MSRADVTDHPRRRVRLGDVALAARVSSSTASRALTDDPRITLRTRERVRSAADRLGYVPNAAARSLRRQATLTLGLLLADFADPVHGQVAAGFEEEAIARGYTVIFVSGFNHTDRERRALKVFTEHRADGIALVSSSLDPAEVLTFVPRSRAVFVQNDHLAGASRTADLPTGSIRSDDARGVAAAVRHLVESGYREIGYVGAGPTASNLMRRDAVAQALRALGVRRAMRRFSAGAEGWRRGVEVAARILPVLPEALVCYDDKLALAVMDGLRTLGVDVPGDVAIVGFDGIPFAALSNPRLTTVATPTAQMGRLAATMLVTAIEAGEPPPSVMLPVELVVRESSPPRRSVVAHA